mmetsp:Transcript_44986/g.149099  ORF Transcript_44986/g.149099 Transcript_44986/m.149099 type:complete len:530 (+) Transcript_44986:631-2220(+)
MIRFVNRAQNEGAPEGVSPAVALKLDPVDLLTAGTHSRAELVILRVVPGEEADVVRRYATAQACEQAALQRTPRSVLPPPPREEATAWRAKTLLTRHVEAAAPHFGSAEKALDIHTAMTSRDEDGAYDGDDDDAPPGEEESCVVCGGGQWTEGHELIACDKCGKFVHRSCDERQLLGLPQGAFTCVGCSKLSAGGSDPSVHADGFLGGARESSAGGRGGEFAGRAQATAHFLRADNVREAVASADNPGRDHVFPVVQDRHAEDPTQSINVVGVVRPSPQPRLKGRPAYWGEVYPARAHTVIRGDTGMQSKALKSAPLRSALRGLARSRMLVITADESLGGCQDEFVSPGEYLTGPRGEGKAMRPQHKFRSEDAHIAAQRQLRVGCALSRDREQVVERMSVVRVSLNDEDSGLHVDTCAHGLMSIVDYLYHAVASIRTRTERAGLMAEQNVHKFEGCVLLPELGGYTRLNRGRDFMHGMLNQLVHGSVRLTAAERLYRGRGNFTSTALFGNGLGRLLRACGGLKYWYART